MNVVYANNSPVIHLGRQGEHQAKQVIFDLSDWIAEYGAGTADLIYQRFGDESPYPIAVEHTADTLIWTVSYTDTEHCGYGRCEAQYRVNNTLVKSKTWKTYVEKTMSEDVGSEPPESEKNWVDQVLEAGTAAKDAAERAEAATIHLPYPNADTGTWWVWDIDSGAYKDSGQFASGGGTSLHGDLSGREAADQHPIEAITDLSNELKTCVKNYDTISALDIIKLTEG